MPFLIALGVILLILLCCIRIVPQATEHVIERLGKYCKTWSAGLHMHRSMINQKQFAVFSVRDTINIRLKLPIQHM